MAKENSSANIRLCFPGAVPNQAVEPRSVAGEAARSNAPATLLIGKRSPRLLPSAEKTAVSFAKFFYAYGKKMEKTTTAHFWCGHILDFILNNIRYVLEK